MPPLSPPSWRLRLLGGLAFLWAGLVLGIAFLEAPVKFTAPSLTREVGLDVGRHVFAAMNRVEWVLAALGLGLAWAARPRRGLWAVLAVAAAALLLETAWLLPALNARAGVIIAGGTLASSGVPLHLVFGAVAGAKVLALLVAGWLASGAGASPRGPEAGVNISRAPTDT